MKTFSTTPVPYLSRENLESSMMMRMNRYRLFLRNLAILFLNVVAYLALRLIGS